MAGEPPRGLRVRPAAAEDAEALAEILNAIIRRGGTTAYETAMTPERMAAKLGGPEGPAFAHVAEDEAGRILGVQRIGPMRDEPGVASIASFVAVDAAQGGVGSALFPHTEAEARRRGYREIDATIRADNAGGLAYYARMGFADFAVARGVPLNDGTPVDRASKRRRL